MVLNAVQSQLPKLIEIYEKELQDNLVRTLQEIKSKNPDEAALFYTNWKKLNSAVDLALGSGSGGKRRQKRTHTIRRRKY